MPYSYWVESGDLCVADSASIIWRGRPDGAPCASAIVLPETDDAIVLLDWELGPRNAYGHVSGSPNLIRVTAAGEVVWRAVAVEDKDVWVAVEWRDGGLVGNTRSCYRIELDPNTGHELSRVFTK